MEGGLSFPLASWEGSGVPSQPSPVRPWEPDPPPPQDKKAGKKKKRLNKAARQRSPPTPAGAESWKKSALQEPQQNHTRPTRKLPRIAAIQSKDRPPRTRFLALHFQFQRPSLAWPPLARFFSDGSCSPPPPCTPHLRRRATGNVSQLLLQDWKGGSASVRRQAGRHTREGRRRRRRRATREPKGRVSLSGTAWQRLGVRGGVG